MITISKSQFIAWAGWVLLLTVLFFEFKCRPGHSSAPAMAVMPAPEVQTKVKIFYLHDTVIHTIPVYHLAPAETVFIPVPAKVDTSLILKDYFAKVFYRDSVCDTILKAWISDTISENQITSRKFSYKILRPLEIEDVSTTTVKVSRPFAFYIGGAFGFSKRVFSGVGPELLLTTPRQIAFGVGYDLLTENLSAKFYWQIK
jgi:hypothetical protein